MFTQIFCYSNMFTWFTTNSNNELFILVFELYIGKLNSGLCLYDWLTIPCMTRFHCLMLHPALTLPYNKTYFVSLFTSLLIDGKNMTIVATTPPLYIQTQDEMDGRWEVPVSISVTPKIMLPPLFLPFSWFFLSNRQHELKILYIFVGGRRNFY